MLGVPGGLARDGLDDVRVDLRQRMVARDAPERVRQGRIAAGVVERVPGLVQERLVVVEPTLRPRDQVDDPGRVGRDHARPGRLLRPVVEVEPDAGDVLDVEAEPLERLDAHRHAAILRVRALERREPPQVARVVRGRHVVAVRTEQRARTSGRAAARRPWQRPCWPPRARARARAARSPSPRRSARPRRRSPESSASSSSDAVSSARRSSLKRGVLGVVELAQLVAVAVAGQDGKLCLCCAERQLLPAPAEADREQPVLRARPPAPPARPPRSPTRRSCAAGRDARARRRRRRPRPHAGRRAAPS